MKERNELVDLFMSSQDPRTRFVGKCIRENFEGKFNLSGFTEEEEYGPMEAFRAISINEGKPYPFIAFMNLPEEQPMKDSMKELKGITEATLEYFKEEKGFDRDIELVRRAKAEGLRVLGGIYVLRLNDGRRKVVVLHPKLFTHILGSKDSAVSYSVYFLKKYPLRPEGLITLKTYRH